MFAKPQQEHKLLEQLVGSWTCETECQMGPDKPPEKSPSELHVRSLGGMWIVAEGSCGSPEGGMWSTIMTLGYDPTAGKYVGTFVGSMMAHLWIYNGSLDKSGKVLTLDTEGPKFDQTSTAKYQDILEFVDQDHFILRSQIMSDAGEWMPFMKSLHRRRK